MIFIQPRWGIPLSRFFFIRANELFLSLSG
jgi:hypothetical protein